MKKILLLAVAALMVTSASAQLKQMSVNNKKTMARPDYVQKPQALMQEKSLRDVPTFTTNKAPKKAGYVDAYWIRPAGLFPGSQVLEDGVYGGGYYMPLYFAKPYSDLVFTAVADGADEGAEIECEWDYQKYIRTDEGWSHETLTYAGNPLVLNYVWGEENEVPYLFLFCDGNLYTYQPGGYEMSGTSDKPVAGAFHVSYIEATPSSYDFYEVEGTELLVSSKTFCYGGRHADQRYLMTYYQGCEPYGNNEYGWWFGKNGGRSNGMPVDGIAQAFEKPASPYLLKQVVVEAAVLEVLAPVDMTCRVYRLPDGISPYDPEASVRLPEEPGELIAYGRAELTPETFEATDGMIVFTLYGEEDGLEYEITPTIDDAILICVDGYNDPEMVNLQDFSAMVSSDDMSDEGYGELAYIKYGLTDEDGNFSGDYIWAGLNNFFSNGAGGGATMMTGFSIFITVDNPYLTFNYNIEDGEFTFPNEGGLMEKVIYGGPEGTIITRSIEFFSYMASADDAWTLSCDGDEVPEWLTIELEDVMEEDAYSGIVNATVVAEPLPEGVPYREAIVRFEYPGAYLDYKFMQGKKPEPQPYNPFDINGDGEVNIADVNMLIDIILNDIVNTRDDGSIVGDVNADGEVNIADVNMLIDYILNM